MMNRPKLAPVLLAVLATTSLGASAQPKWPDRPVRIVVPFASAGGVDIAARLIADKLKDPWGQPVVIDNKPGANTLIAAQAVLSSPKDGYTFLITNANTFYLPVVNPAVKFRPLEELTPIAELSVDQLVLLAPSTLPSQRLPQIIELARKDPKSFAFGAYFGERDRRFRSRDRFGLDA